VSPRAQRSLAAALATLLATLSLTSVFRHLAPWLVPCVVAIGVAAVCGALGRRAGLPSVVVPLLTPLGLVGVVTAVGAPQHAFLRVVPSRLTLAELHQLVLDGFDDIRDYPAPAPPTPGLILLAVAGVFVVAALVDLLAVTASRPVLAGVPLLALYAVLAALRPAGIGLFHFLAAALGWVLLLVLDGRERLGRWGRVLGRQQAEPGTSVLAGGAAGRVAGLSLGTAAVLPLLLPSLGSGLFSHGGGGGGFGDGGGSISVVPPLVTVQSRLHDPATTALFRVTTPLPQFYRLTPLDEFTGASFTLHKDQAGPGKRVDGALPGTPGLQGDVPTQAVDAVVAVGQLKEPYLPLPYSPTSVTVTGRWQLAPHLRTVFSLHDTTLNRTFSVHSEVPLPTPAQLRAQPRAYDETRDDRDTREQLALDLALPSTLTPMVRQVAAEVTRRAGTDFDRLLALQRYFTDGDNFAYDLNASVVAGNQGILDFLRDKTGYCEQFASVFTLMARTLGVPTRVAVGFTPGTRQDDGTWVVTNKDAHAWPEAWFDGVGWVKFEPTPRSGLGTVAPGYLASVPPVPPSAARIGAASPTPSSGPSRSVNGPDPERGDRPDPQIAAAARRSGGSGGGGGSVVGVLLLGVLLLGSVPGLSRLLLRRRRGRLAAGTWAGTAAGSGAVRGHRPAGAAAAAHAAWSELVDTATDLRVPLRASESPRATGRRLQALLPAGLPGLAAGRATVAGTARTELLGEAPEPVPVATGDGGAAAAAPALARLTRAEERARYAPEGGEVELPAGLDRDASTVRRALLAGRPRGTRVRAALLPPSTTARARRRLGNAVEVVAAAGGRVPAALTGRLRALVQRG